MYNGQGALIHLLSCTSRYPRKLKYISKIQVVVYYQCCVLIGCATTRLYVIAY